MNLHKEFEHRKLANVELFAILAEYFDANFSNGFIRQAHQDGLEVETTCHRSMTTARFKFAPEILSDSFLREARSLHGQIIASNKVTKSGPRLFE